MEAKARLILNEPVYCKFKAKYAAISMQTFAEFSLHEAAIGLSHYCCDLICGAAGAKNFVSNPMSVYLQPTKKMMQVEFLSPAK